LAKSAFDFSAEFPASVAKLGFGEKFAPEVLKQTIHLVSTVRLRVVRSVARPFQWIASVGVAKVR
jgi:hypothetical protein